MPCILLRCCWVLGMLTVMHPAVYQEPWWSFAPLEPPSLVLGGGGVVQEDNTMKARSQKRSRKSQESKCGEKDGVYEALTIVSHDSKVIMDFAGITDVTLG